MRYGGYAEQVRMSKQYDDIDDNPHYLRYLTSLAPGRPYLEVQELDLTPVGQLDRAVMSFDGDARKVCGLLSEARQAVEKGGLAAVGRTHQSRGGGGTGPAFGKRRVRKNSELGFGGAHDTC